MNLMRNILVGVGAAIMLIGMACTGAETPVGTAQSEQQVITLSDLLRLVDIAEELEDRATPLGQG